MRRIHMATLVGIVGCACAGDLAPVERGEDPEDDAPGWAPLSAAITGLQPSLSVAGPEALYAVVGDRVCVWRDGAWTPVTAVISGLEPAFHLVSEDQIYAIVGDRICKWNGEAWAPLTAELVGLRPAFRFRAENDVYALIGDVICH